MNFEDNIRTILRTGALGFQYLQCRLENEVVRSRLQPAALPENVLQFREGRAAVPILQTLNGLMVGSLLP
jgi:hypothetical protein